MRLFLAACLIIFFGSCNRNTVDLEYTNAKGEVPQLGNLVFRFSNALAADSVLNQWDSTQYVRFTPAIPGRFRWEQPDQLVFSPSRPLPPSTNFRAELTDDIIEKSKFDQIDDADAVEFFTPALKLEDLRASWVLESEQSTRAVPRLDLYFNYDVSPALIKDKLKLQVEGKSVTFRMVTLSDDSRVSLDITGIQPKDEDINVGVSIEKGVLPKGGSNATMKTITAATGIPSPFNLVINDVTAEHDGLSGTVSVQTSQQVSLDKISSLVKIEPAVKFTVEATVEGFAVKSDQFDADKTYLLTLEKGMRGKIGGVLHEEYNNNIGFGELHPSVSFATNKSVYLSAQGNRMIEMKIVNVPQVKVVISKIYESNLLNAGRYGYNPKETRGGNDEEDYYDYYGDDLTAGDVIYEKEIDTRSLPKMGNSRLFTFNVEDRLPDFKGIYHIKVRSTKNYWVSDSRFISISDLGLIAKEGRDKLFVFVNSIKTVQPVSGVNVVAYGKNNQVLGLGATNQDGVAEIEYARREFAGFKPAMIIAKTESDFNYLPFNDTRVNTSRFEVGGKRLNAASLDAFIYPERDIYRPGERVNFSVIVRNLQWQSPGELPLKFKFLMPNGKELRSFRKTLSEQGSTEGQIDISEAAITGSYTLEVYTSNDVLIGTKNFSIEEFVPDRIKVSATLDRPFLRAGEEGKLAVNAVNFFGPPAAGRNYEVEIQLKSTAFHPKKYAKYNFAIQNQGLSLDKVVREGKLDGEGNAVENYEVPAMFANSGILKTDFYTTVFDETGRPVSRIASANVYTQPVFFGVGDDGYWYYALNQPVKFPLIALDKDEKIINGAKAVVKMIKHEYRTVLSKSGSYFRYESQEQDKLMSEQTITVSGEATAYSFVPRSPGNYEIRVSIPGANAYVSRKFYSYGSWGGDNNSFEVNTEGNIDIETDKSVYNAGDKAKILFKSPFNGKMLVTIEQEKVLSYQYVNVEKRTATIELPLTNEHLPNIFITATLVKPHNISDIPLTVAHGFQNVKVEDKSRRNSVEIVATKSSRSERKQQVTVKTTPGSFVTLAAVDNGVLQVTDFKTPDPYGYFYSPRALEVDAYDLYPYLFPEVRGRLSSTGGDGDLDLQKRVNPMPSKRVKIVSYWSGIVKAGADGQAKISFDVPKFSGQVRLMAVAYKNNSFGSAESAITIADPMVISAGLPRFLSPGDTVTVPVTVTNTTTSDKEAKVTLQATGPLQVVGNNAQALTLKAGAEQRALFSVLASSSIDTGKIVVNVQAGGEVFKDETAIGVRPASPLQMVTSSGSLAAGKTQRLNISASDFLPGSIKHQIVVSRNPTLESAEQLRYLVQYPYGCTEQIVSAAFPQLYYGDLAKQLSHDPQTENINQNIIEAIRKIKLRQLYNGAVMLWDNGEAHWWTTIYAAHFLIEAKKAGFDVDDDLINTILSYINSRLRNKNLIDYYYNRDQKKKIAPKEVAYSLYVLALAARPNVPAMNYYKANPAILSLDSKYLLSVAYAVSGDRKKFGELLPASFTGETSVPQTGGSFYSPIRDEAIALNALIEVDPSNAQIPLMAKHVADQLRNRSWYSTQECAFSFLALGKLARSAEKSNVTAEIRQGGKTVARFDGKELKYNIEARGNENIELVTKGEGRLYYFMQTEGISKSGQYNEEDKFIRVRRQFFDRFGNRITDNRFSVNGLVIVQVSLERAFDTDVDNIVVTDILPAGFEIENPRTKEIPGMKWIKNASEPDALDVRDDRINLFVDLHNTRQVYYYAVRAVSPGIFKMGPVGADAMYNGEYHSYNGGGVVVITE
jgi:uncharacterized protein YfaS (alpha-2-macroglobulin family)